MNPYLKYEYFKILEQNKRDSFIFYFPKNN
jgi:hypothetical protein